MDNELKEKILFVDDEEFLLEVAEEFFLQKGYRVATAKNGLKAIEILKAGDIDCCFTDINMPEMNGIELAEYIRKLDNLIPVIVLTAYPSLENTISTLKNGVVDYLIKPVKLEQMEVCLKQVLRRRQLLVENIYLKKELEEKEKLEKINRELRYKANELNTLNNIMSTLSSISTSSEVFNRVVDLAVEINSADESKFFLINDKLMVPVEVAVSFSDKHDREKAACKNDEGIFTKVDEEKEHKAIEALVMETAVDGIPLLISENNKTKGLPETINSFMAVPLKIRNKVFGIHTASIKGLTKLFDKKDLYYLSFMAKNTANNVENLVLYDNIFEQIFSTLYAFVLALEVHDPYTRQHSDRVSKLACAIAGEAGCSEEELDIINLAGRLHDIGKIGINDNILLKPGKLTNEEFEIIKKHPVIGANIIGQINLWDREQEIIRFHHEKYDGTGYPDGLKGENIPFLSRILSIADAFDAMQSDRAYRKKMDIGMIMDIINNEAGTQFDPGLVKVFNNLYKKGKILTESDYN